MCARERAGARKREGEGERVCVASCLSFMLARSRFQLPPHAGQLICISLICTLTRGTRGSGRVRQQERGWASNDRDSAWARSFRNICLGLLSVINVAVIENYFHFYVYHYRRPLQRATRPTDSLWATVCVATEAWVLGIMHSHSHSHSLGNYCLSWFKRPFYFILLREAAGRVHGRRRGNI